MIPPRALHEIWLLPFEMAVRDAQPASIMCAYNQLNGVSACSNGELLDATLRDRWGFGGYVMTDRSALHDLGPLDQGRRGLGACPSDAGALCARPAAG